MYLIIFGLSPSPRHAISSIDSHHLFLIARLLVKFYMVKFLRFICFVLLVVFAFPFYVIICPINYHLALFLVFLLAIVFFIRVFVPWIRKLTESICLSMFKFLRIIFLMLPLLFLLQLALIMSFLLTLVTVFFLVIVLSPIGVTSASSSTSTPCVPCADSSPILMPPITPSQPSSPKLALDVPPLASSSFVQSSTCSRPMITRARDGIVKPRILHSLCPFTTPPWFRVHLAVKEPRGFKSAVKHPAWLLAMDDEISILNHNNTWRLVPRPANHNVVGCRWIFKTKLHADGSNKHHKARLLAQGFSQKNGIDFEETFSPVV